MLVAGGTVVVGLPITAGFRGCEENLLSKGSLHLFDLGQERLGDLLRTLVEFLGGDFGGHGNYVTKVPQ